MTGGGDNSTPLASSSFPSSSIIATEIANPPYHRDGTLWTALAHIITAVIGSGVLSLAWSFSQLGWIAGPLVLVLFAFVTLLSSFLLSNCYRSPDPEFGPARNGSYIDAVQMILGKRSAAICGVFVTFNFVKVGIVYTITAAISMRAILKSYCYHRQGVEATCDFEIVYFMLLFGLLQALFSQISDFQNTKWLSIVAAIMSFTYSIIGSGLGLARLIENGELKGSIAGVTAPSAAEKAWSIAQAIGDVAFAFPFSLVLLNIQNTLKSPPSEVVTMKKTSAIAVCITTIFYFSCGGFGYAALGDSTPGNILTGFGSYKAYWLVDLANACVILHLVGAYQVFSQPLFANAERWLASRFPESRTLHDSFSFKIPSKETVRVNVLRICFRTAYVACLTAVAVVFPYFNQVVGVAGAINFWPIVVYFPIEMYLIQMKIGPWTAKSVVLRGYSAFCFMMMLFAFIGSVKGLISARFGKKVLKFAL